MNLTYEFDDLQIVDNEYSSDNKPKTQNISNTLTLFGSSAAYLVSINRNKRHQYLRKTLALYRTSCNNARIIKLNHQ